MKKDSLRILFMCAVIIVIITFVIGSCVSFIEELKELDQDMMKTYDINKKDEILNSDINLDKGIFDRNEFNYFKEDNDESLTPFQKQEKLIKKLLRTKNYQKFVKKLLNSEPITVTPDGEIIEFNFW